MSQDPGQPLLNTGVNFTPTIHHALYPAIDPKQYDLTSRSVFITGASKGLGAAIAHSMAMAGASPIILAARSPLTHIVSSVKAAALTANKPEPTLISHTLDVTLPSNVSQVCASIASALGDRGLDILINNAGFLENWSAIADSDPATWWTHYEVNVRGLYLVTRALLPAVQRSTLRTVVNMASIGAHMAFPGGSAYNTSKLAVLRFTEFLAEEYGRGEEGDGVLTVALHPGGVKTELSSGLPGELARLLVDEEELCGGFLCWLVGGDGRRMWLGGRYLSVNWDVGEVEARREEIVRGELLKVRMCVRGFGEEGM